MDPVKDQADPRVAAVRQVKVSAKTVVSQLRAVREEIRERYHGQAVRKQGESWHDFICAGRRI
jgi:hypothetical protein